MEVQTTFNDCRGLSLKLFPSMKFTVSLLVEEELEAEDDMFFGVVVCNKVQWYIIYVYIFKWIT